MKQAFYLTAWVHSFLFWLYIAMRIIVNNVWWHALFIDTVPFFNFLYLGIIAFLSSFLFLFLFARELWS